jgi:hypothetical protein
MRKENDHPRHENYWEGADLLMEIVSPDPKDHERDYVTKLLEYAAARIKARPHFFIPFSIFAHVSASVTLRLNTKRSGRESFGSTEK